MSRYAENTSVSVDASRNEIERTLRRYGADSFVYGWEASRALVGFRMCDRQVKFILTLPDKGADEFKRSPKRRQWRSPEQAYTAWEQACRQRWRALALVIKAKLEAVESGITCFEDEFMAHIVLPNGQRVGDWMQPQIAVAYESGRMPAFLPDLRDQG